MASGVTDVESTENGLWLNIQHPDTNGPGGHRCCAPAPLRWLHEYQSRARLARSEAILHLH